MNRTFFFKIIFLAPLVVAVVAIVEPVGWTSDAVSGVGDGDVYFVIIMMIT